MWLNNASSILIKTVLVIFGFLVLFLIRYFRCHTSWKMFLVQFKVGRLSSRNVNTSKNRPLNFADGWILQLFFDHIIIRFEGGKNCLSEKTIIVYSALKMKGVYSFDEICQKMKRIAPQVICHINFDLFQKISTKIAAKIVSLIFHVSGINSFLSFSVSFSK
jgi:hypothetical protein